MIKDLLDVADKLDAMGLDKDASKIDLMIQKTGATSRLVRKLWVGTSRTRGTFCVVW